jgi:RimJ/RimL family protein N-acetyltransferase
VQEFGENEDRGRVEFDLKVEVQYVNSSAERLSHAAFSGIDKKNLNFGPVAHLVERCIRIAEVVGSSPIGSTKSGCSQTSINFMQQITVDLLKKEDVHEFTQVLVTIWNDLQHFYSQEAQAAEKEKWTVENVLKKLSCPDNLLISAKNENTIVAACVAEYECNTVFLYLMGVLPEYQKQGIGTQMHHFIFDYLRQKNLGIHKVWCDTIVSNAAGIAILKKLGYQQEAELKKHWYGDNYYLWSYWL